MKSRRRRNLVKTAGLLALLAIGPRSLHAASRPAQGSTPQAQVLQICRAVAAVNPAARIIGEAYHAATPVTQNLDELLERLTIELGFDAATPGAIGAPLLLARLGQRVSEDFANGRVVRLRGWLLSATELSLCAIAALDRQPGTSPLRSG